MNMVQVYFMRGGGTVPVCHLGSFALVSYTEESAVSVQVPEAASEK